MKKFNLLASVALVCLFILGCEKNETNPTNYNSVLLDNITLNSEGFLVFKDTETFKLVLQNLVEHENSGLLIDEKFPNYISSKKAFEELTEEKFKGAKYEIESFKDYAMILDIDGELYLEPVIDATILGIVANQKGLYQINHTIYKYTYNNVYSFDASEYAVFKQKGLEGINNLTTEPITRSRSLQKQDILECINEYETNKRRLIGEVSTVNTPAYGEVKVTTKHHKKTVGVWLRKKCDRLILDGAVDFDKTVLGSTTSHSTMPYKNKTNQSHISEVLDFTVLTGVSFDITSADVDHEGECAENANCNNTL